MKETVFEITSNRPLARNIYEMTLAGDTSAITAPGKFVTDFFCAVPSRSADMKQEN